MVKGRRLKLFYATQAGGKEERQLQPLEFVLFVNDPQLINETYRRYLESRIRTAEPYPGLPIVLTLRRRTGVRHENRGVHAAKRNKQHIGRKRHV
jgi:GTP-binding protein